MSHGRLIVAADGYAAFSTVQAAVDAALPGAVIEIRPGVYRGHVSVPKEKLSLTFLGTDPRRTVLTDSVGANSLKPDGGKVGTSDSASVSIFADGFRAEGLTFENAAFPRSVVGQAVALKVQGDRCAFRNCRFLSFQDTLYATGDGRRQLFEDCEIQGDVDFVFGHAAAYFRRCKLVSRGAGFVTAHARTATGGEGGYVFESCLLTAAPGVADGSVYLGRPWRPFARVLFLRCTLGPHLRPEGWDNWRDPKNEATAFFAEVACDGVGADRSRRVAWARAPGAKELAALSEKNLLRGWKPRRTGKPVQCDR